MNDLVSTEDFSFKISQRLKKKSSLKSSGFPYIFLELRNACFDNRKTGSLNG